MGTHQWMAAARRRILLALAMPALVALLGACRPGVQEVAQVIATVAPEPTRPAPTAGAVGNLPDIDNDVPAGICETTADVRSRVVRAPASLFRALALDSRVGQADGDGIRLVRFTIAGERLAYIKEEVEAPFCALGGNEPECGRWPRDAAGRYTWGEGGLVVEPGRYDVFIEVVSDQPDSLSGSHTCSWGFAMDLGLR